MLVPPSARVQAPAKHVAVAWDRSRVTTRALWDALAFLPQEVRITVMTIRDKKPLSGGDLAGFAAHLRWRVRGYNAMPLVITLGERSHCRRNARVRPRRLERNFSQWAGYGHSRLRDFILGGATKGVLRDLRLPVLLSHSAQPTLLCGRVGSSFRERSASALHLRQARGGKADGSTSQFVTEWWGTADGNPFSHVSLQSSAIPRRMEHLEG